MKAHTLLRRCAAEYISVADIADAISAHGDNLPEGIRNSVAERLNYDRNSITFHAAFDAAVALNELRAIDK